MALKRRSPADGPDPNDPSNFSGVNDTAAGFGAGNGYNQTAPKIGPGPEFGVGATQPKDPGFITKQIQNSEGPRERPSPGGGGSMFAPPSPQQPSPVDAQPGGNVSMATPQPFQPMVSPGAASLVSPAGAGPQLRSLFGSSGGLLGGGLGAALTPGGENASDPISGLIQALQNRPKGLGSF